MGWLRNRLINWNNYLDDREKRGKKAFYKTKRFWIIVLIILFIKFPDTMLFYLLKIVVFLEEVIR